MSYSRWQTQAGMHLGKTIETIVYCLDIVLCKMFFKILLNKILEIPGNTIKG